MAVDEAEMRARVSRLQAAVADLAVPFDELPGEVADDVLAGVESAQRVLTTVGYEAINGLRRQWPTRLGRLRDHLANLLHVSAREAGGRIATARDLAGPDPALPETAAAARHGLIGAEHVSIIRDTVAKLPDTATATDRARFDLELTGVAVAERPEVLRRDAALLLAEFDATHADPVTRERSRAARRALVIGPQDPDGMRRGRFCLDPEAGAYLEILLAKLARPGMCNATDPLPTIDADPGPTDEQWQARRRYDEQTLGQTLWYPPKTVDPSRQPKTNRHHRRPKRPEPGPDAA